MATPTSANSRKHSAPAESTASGLGNIQAAQTTVRTQVQPAATGN